MVRRGEIWWAELPVPEGSEPGYRCPVLIVQSDDFNRSRIRTVFALALTSNLNLAAAPGNVSLARRATALRMRSTGMRTVRLGIGSTFDAPASAISATEETFDRDRQLSAAKETLLTPA